MYLLLDKYLTYVKQEVFLSLKNEGEKNIRF